ncbi:hypothetical protein EDD15DRAFT_2377761 [Pisolithus albus]|nr:hypothetical protein EDD15DRAFT_2377761 [Pisolithus albus]
MAPSPYKASRQRLATTRWLSKPGVLEAQREKARLRAARNRERKRAKALAGDVLSDGTVNRVPDQCDVYSDTESVSTFLHSSAASPTPTLPHLRLSIDAWKSDWGPESAWLKKFDESLRKAREKGLASMDRFFKDTARGTQRGRQLDTFLQIFDLLEVVLAEVKFFEVKLDEYAPAVPYSKVSDARYYSGM